LVTSNFRSNRRFHCGRGTKQHTHAGTYRPNEWNAAVRSFGGRFNGECWAKELMFGEVLRKDGGFGASERWADMAIFMWCGSPCPCMCGERMMMVVCVALVMKEHKNMNAYWMLVCYSFLKTDMVRWKRIWRRKGCEEYGGECGS